LEINFNAFSNCSSFLKLVLCILGSKENFKLEKLAVNLVTAGDGAIGTNVALFRP